MKTYNFPNSDRNRMEIYAVENTETYNIQIFNTIEEIQDIIEAAEIPANPERNAKEIHASG